jgi:DNA-directed RNA polymerase specialized sigma24 family protein
LESLLSRIPSRLATAVVLSDGFGLDIREVAVAMGSTTAAASSRVRRGRLELKRRSSGQNLLE